MYEAFFGLKEKPFNQSPDPRYLYLSPSHQEALAHLIYGIQERKGFIVVTGEVGTGKTTLLHTLMENLDRNVHTAFVVHPKLRFPDILRYILADFGLPEAGATTARCLMQLNQFLIERHKQGETTVLVIDEAQDLSLSLLEDIRLLSNLEIAGEKLLQIVLVGQLALKHKLQSPQLRPLRQRIGITCEIRPLSYAETRDYICHRVTVAGGKAQDLFSPQTLKAIHASTGGLPRAMHTLCDEALLSGYATGQQEISPKLVRQINRELKARPRRGILAAHPWKAAALLAGLILLSTLSTQASFSPVQSSLWHWYESVKARLGGAISESDGTLTGHQGDSNDSLPPRHAPEQGVITHR